MIDGYKNARNNSLERKTPSRKDAHSAKDATKNKRARLVNADICVYAKASARSQSFISVKALTAQGKQLIKTVNTNAYILMAG